jgi:nitroreductase
MEIRSTNQQNRPGVTTSQDLTRVIDERRATNHFKSETISDEEMEKILHAAQQAPSGYNLQPWRFIVVRDNENKARLQKAAFDQEKVSEASAVIIFIGMKEQTGQWAKDVFEEGNRRGLGKPENNEAIIKGALEFISSVGWKPWLNRHVMISFGFAMLMAESLGYDTAPMEGFDPAAVKREFGIPEDAEVTALLAVGRGEQPDKKNPGRFPLNRIAFREKYAQQW